MTADFLIADWAEKYFSAQSARRNSTSSEPRSQGLFSSWSKLSPKDVASSRLVAPGSPRMVPDPSLSSSRDNGFHAFLMKTGAWAPVQNSLSILNFPIFFFVLQRSLVHYTRLQRTVLCFAIYMELIDLARLSAKLVTTSFLILPTCTSAQLENGPFMPFQVNLTARVYHGRIALVSEK